MNEPRLLRLSIGLIVMLLASTFVAEAQRTKTRNAPRPTVVAGKSGVYITFERYGNRKPLRTNEGGEGIWLRLHNNMLYSISLCAFGISETGKQLTMYGKGLEVGLKYDVLLNPVAITEEPPNIKVPVGYNTNSSCHMFEVKSGTSMIFSVPAEHLIRGLSIKLRFVYDWEDQVVDNPAHFVYFNSDSLPQS